MATVKIKLADGYCNDSECVTPIVAIFLFLLFVSLCEGLPQSGPHQRDTKETVHLNISGVFYK
jgi:hypothetical protein